nr:aluminum-activated malate transporter 12-like [Ipomoea batatas]
MRWCGETMGSERFEAVEKRAKVLAERAKRVPATMWRRFWNVGREDPRRVIHAIKVGVALTLVSLLYLIEPLFKQVGQSAIWAVMTVVVVLEFTAECVKGYFSDEEKEIGETESPDSEDPIGKGYKAVLDSKSSDENLALYASWEPRHSLHCYKFPWQRYVKLGAVLRHFGYTVVALHGCLQTEIQKSSSLPSVKTDTSALMDWRSKRGAAGPREKEEERKVLRPTLSKIAFTSLNFSEALPFAAFASLLVELVARLEIVIEEVEELGKIAHFKEFDGGDDADSMIGVKCEKPTKVPLPNQLPSHAVD